MKTLLLFGLIAANLLLMPNINFGQAPDLGAASGFVLFTAVGALNNTGETIIIGDIGTDAGAITGFPPGLVTGVIYYETDPASAAAAMAVVSAYDQLLAAPCDAIISTSLGNNQVLTQNVYCMGAASVLNGNLILDGEGDPDAAFIFQIDGAFSTGTFSSVSVINSASLDNVYWQINGAVTVADFSVFRGTVIANGAITFLNGASLEGRALSLAGAINIDAIKASILGPVQVLPIELLYFTGDKKPSCNLLSWATATEKNNSYFILERSTDGVNFTEAGRINGAGTSSSTHFYSFSDDSFEKTVNYYRLKQTDYPGETQTFHIISMDNSDAVRTVIRSVDVLGREVGTDFKGLRFIYYNDGSVAGKSGG